MRKRLTIARTLESNQLWSSARVGEQFIRPHLTALLRHHGEAKLLIVELQPDIFPKQRERSRKS